MYRIKQISTNRYLLHPEISNYNDTLMICKSTKGKFWKQRQAAIDAFKITIKTALKCKLDVNDFVLEKNEMVVIETITATTLN